jgi:Rad3-related DNA helicase
LLNLFKYNPHKNKSFRQGQEKAILDMLKLYDNNKKIITLNSPTASGKGTMLYVLGRIFEKEYNLKNITFTSPQVALISSGNLFDIPKLTGKSNYPCLAIKDCFADECPFTSKEEGFSVCGDCPYRLAKAKFKQAKFGATTFSRYAADPSIFMETSVLLVDESSDLESELLKKATIDLNLDLKSVTKQKNIKEQVTDLQKYLSDFDVKSHLQKRSDELQLTVGHLSKQCKEYRSECFKSGRRPTSSEIKRLKSIQYEYNHYHRMETACGHALRYLKLEVPYVLTVDIEETYEPMLRKKVPKPIGYFKLLDAHVPFGDLISNLDCIVLASGTPTTELITSKSAEVKVNHPIPVDRRLVYYEPVGSMNLANREVTARPMARRIAELHNLYNQHTLVHCGSYLVARLLDEHLCNLHNNVIVQEQGYREEALTDWQKSDDVIFLSVNYEKGISCDGPKYPLNIISKIPFPNFGDTWVTKRNALDKNHWYYLTTCVAVQQSAGRCTRAPNDFSMTYILDQSFWNLLLRNRGLFQKWFLDALCIGGK